MASRTVSSEEVSRQLRSRKWTLVGLMLAAAAENWTASGVSLTLTDLTGTLSASSDEGSWALTVYSSAYAVSLACAHRLSARFGNRVYLASTAALFACASLWCAFSPNLQLFLFGRVLQGLAGGAFLTRTFVFTGQQFAPSERIRALVFWGVSYFILGRVFSPIVNGWFADRWNWRALFLIGAALAAVASALFARFTLHSWFDERDSYSDLDVPGMLMLVCGVACLQTMLSRGEIDGWYESREILLLLLCAMAANALLAAWQLLPSNRFPLFTLRMIETRGVLASAVIGFPVGMLLAGSVYVIPQYLRGVESHSAFQTGCLLSLSGLASAGVLLGSVPFASKLLKYGSTVLAVALLLEAAAEWTFAHYLTVDTPDRYLWLPLLANGAFVALSVPALGLSIFTTMPGGVIGSARTIYYGMRQFGIATGVTCAVVLIDRRLSFHTSRLLDSYVARNLPAIGAPDPSKATLALHASVRQQAFVLTYADVFHVEALIALGTILLLPLLPFAPVPAQQAQGNGSLQPARRAA